jgi:hypothetical protein
MSKTFTNGGYSVTVHDDRSIDVRPGDWISKYSAAIYGDPNIYWERFKKKVGNGYAPLDNPHMIIAGQKVYHPSPLPGEDIVIEFPTKEVIGEKVQASRLEEWFKWLFSLVNPVNEWWMTDSAGVELSAIVFAGNYFTIGAQRATDAEKTWYHGVGAGFSYGPESIAGSLTMSTTDFKSAGFIGKFITAGTRLNKDEICGTYLVFDVGFGFPLGYSLSFLMFGFKFPPVYVLANLVRYLRGDDLLPPRHLLPMGLIVMNGLTATTPALGISLKGGLMHRWECIPGMGK